MWVRACGTPCSPVPEADAEALALEVVVSLGVGKWLGVLLGVGARCPVGCKRHGVMEGVIGCQPAAQGCALQAWWRSAESSNLACRLPHEYKWRC